MELNELLSEKFNEFVSSTQKSADTVKQYVVLKKEIKEAEDSLAVSFYELGSEIYDGKMSGETDEEAVDILVDEITEEKKKLEELYHKFNKLNGKVECPKCKSVVSCDFDFCPKCGAKLFDVVMENGREKSGKCSCEEKAEQADEEVEIPTEDAEAEPEIEVEFTVSEDGSGEE